MGSLLHRGRKQPRGGGLPEGKAPNLLRIALLAARGLKARKALLGAGKADPAATCVCQGHVARTGRREKTLAPEWHEAFALPVEAVEEGDALVASLKVEDVAAGVLFSTTHALGELEVPLSDLIDGGRRRGWLPFKDDAGEIEIVARWCYDPKLDHFAEGDAYPGRPANCLRIAVVQGRGLARKSGKLSADAYASIRVGRQVAFTAAAKSFKAPDQPWWNDELSLPVEAPGLDDDEERAALRRDAAVAEVSVFSQGSRVARGVIDVASYDDKQRRRTWLTLKPEGRCETSSRERPAIDILIRWEHDPGYDFGRCAANVDDEDDAGREPNEVGLAVVQIRERRFDEGARPPGWRAERDRGAQPLRARLRVGNLEAASQPRHPAMGAAFFRGDASALARPKDGVPPGTHLEVFVDRVSNGSKPRCVAIGEVSVDAVFASESNVRRVRRWVALRAPPKRSRALSRAGLALPRRASKALAGGSEGADLEAEVCAWACFNAARSTGRAAFEEPSRRRVQTSNAAKSHRNHGLPQDRAAGASRARPRPGARPAAADCLVRRGERRRGGARARAAISFATSGPRRRGGRGARRGAQRGGGRGGRAATTRGGAGAAVPVGVHAASDARRPVKSARAEIRLFYVQFERD